MGELRHQNSVIRENIQEALKTAGTPVPDLIGDKVLLVVDVSPPGSSTITISDGSDDLAINGDGSITARIGLPRLSSDQTLVTYTTTGTGASQTIFTTTAGKTFYLMGYQVAGGGANGGQIFKADGTTTLFNIKSGASNDAVLASAVPLYAYPASTAVKASITNAVSYTIWGYEQ